MSDCKECPHVVGDSYDRDCSFPDCMGGLEEANKKLSDEAFRAFVESLPDKHWSKYDLQAVRLGWDAAMEKCINGIKVYLNSQYGKFGNKK